MTERLAAKGEGVHVWERRSDAVEYFGKRRGGREHHTRRRRRDDRH